ncbi:MAG TPA: hypothetical protein VGK19_25570 [Capsulimonadaceae bacterium]|jgi:hypothetical protein
MKHYFRIATFIAVVLPLCSCMAAPLATEPPKLVAETNLKAVATIDLVNPKRATDTLDAQFCNRADLVYDLSVVTTPNPATFTDKQSRALFTLGRNMHGQLPNSVTVMVWEGGSLFARMTSSTMGDTAQVISANSGLKPGEPNTIHVRWTHDTISLDVNGKHIGDGSMAGEFLWPSTRPFFIGYEDTNSYPWGGALTSGTLTVYAPRIRATFAGGMDSGYFTGNGTHSYPLNFTAGDPKSLATKLSVTDIDGKTVVDALSPSRVDASAQTFTLPALPYGWYVAKAVVSGSESTVDVVRQITITPEPPKRDSADISPFGIANPIQMSPGRYDPIVVDAQFKRMATMGIRWYRFWLDWDSVQQTPESFDWKALDDIVSRASKYGLTLYPCIVGGSKPWQSYATIEKSKYPIMAPNCYMPKDMGQWKTYIRTLGERYKGKITNWQVWNESDARNGFFPYRTEDYVNVLKVTSTELRAADPKNVIGLSGFAGGFGPGGIAQLTHTDKNSCWGLGEFWALNPQQYYDVMDCHFYSVDKPGQSWDPQVAVALGLRKAMAEHGDGAKPLWDSEVSFLTGVPGTVGGWANVPLLSGKDQAARLVQLHVQSLAVGIVHTMWYSIRGDCGVMNTDFSPLPAYAAHVQLARLLGGAKFEKTLKLAPNVRAYRFSGPGGWVTALWTTSGVTQVKLAKPVKGQLVDLMGNSETLRSTASIEVSTVPRYLVTRDAADVALAAAAK